MSLETIVTRFGYPGLLVGLFLEGETALVLAAFMAHRGYMNLPLVILTGFVVAFGSDQFFFWTGRLHGTQFLEKRPTWAPNVEKARSLLKRNATLLFFGVRFVYGLRTVLPFVIGMSRIDPKRFVFLNLAGSIIWALVFGTVGYLFGSFMELVLGDIHRHESWITLGILFIGSAGVFLYHLYTSRHEREKKINNQSQEQPTDFDD